MHEPYIVLCKCSTSRAVTLILFESNINKNFSNSIKKFITRRGCLKNIVYDNGKGFTSQENQSFLCRTENNVEV